MTRVEARLIAEELFKLQEAKEQYREPFITRKEAAEYLKVAVSTIDHDQSIPRYLIGGKSVRFRKSQLDKWVASQN